MKTLSRFLVDQAVAVLAPKLQQALFHHVRLSLASGDAAGSRSKNNVISLGVCIGREHSLASDLQMRSSGRRRHSCATAGPTRAPFGVRYTPQPSPIGAIFMRARPTRDRFECRSDLLESTESCRSVCLGENADLSIVVIDNGSRGP
jgi:hypothetical protein